LISAFSQNFEGKMATTGYKLIVSEPYFTLLREGKKVVEGRKKSPTWKDMQVGDRLIISSPSTEGKAATFQAVVSGINYYSGENSLRSFLECETLARTLPGVTSFEEAERIYTGFLGSKEEIAKYGMMAIQIGLG
jgi:ASC-1-like (ASCH) protein